MEREIHLYPACSCSPEFKPKALRIVVQGQKGRLGIDNIKLGEDLCRDLVADGASYALVLGEGNGEQHVLGGAAADLGLADASANMLHRARRRFSRRGDE